MPSGLAQQGDCANIPNSEGKSYGQVVEYIEGMSRSQLPLTPCTG